MVQTYDYTPYITVKEAAKILGLTTQAVFIAMKKGKLVCNRNHGRWKLSLTSVNAYPNIRYNASYKKINGKLVYDRSKGLYSVTQLADILNVPPQKIYYLIRRNVIPSQRIGKAYIIKCDSPILFYKKFLIKKTRHIRSKQLELNLN